MVVQVIFVIFVFVISFSKECDAVIAFLRVGHGTSISFIDLWELNGYSVGTKDVFRNGVLDSDFITGCPEKIYFKIFRSPNNNTDFFALRYHQPYANNSVTGWLISNPSSCNKNVDISTMTLKITPNEDVILKAYKDNQDQHLYFAVYNPKHLGPGYPKYYVYPDGQGHPSYGTIPGNKCLFKRGKITWMTEVMPVFPRRVEWGGVMVFNALDKILSHIEAVSSKMAEEIGVSGEKPPTFSKLADKFSQTRNYPSGIRTHPL